MHCLLQDTTFESLTISHRRSITTGRLHTYLSTQNSFWAICAICAKWRKQFGVSTSFFTWQQQLAWASPCTRSPITRPATICTANLFQAILDTHSQPEKVIVASSMSIYGEGKYLCSECGDVASSPRSLEQMR